MLSKMHLEIIFILVAFPMKATHSGYVNSYLTALEARIKSDESVIRELNHQIYELGIKVAENKVKDDIIKSLREANASRNCSNSAGALEVQKLRSKDESAVKPLEDKNLKLIQKINKLKDWIQLKGPLPTSRELEEGVAETNCATFGNFKGVRKIQVRGISPFPVLCDGDTAGAGWTVIQRRFDGSVDFYRNWTEYRNGFGNINGEFFIGLEKLYRLTNSNAYELYIELEGFSGRIEYARFSYFLIGSEAEDYELVHLGQMTGNAEDHLSSQLNCKFTTYDRDNDSWEEGNCAVRYHGGWWYKMYVGCNLNGRYFHTEVINKEGLHYKSLVTNKSVKMLIRPVKNS